GHPGTIRALFTGQATVPSWAGALSVAATYGCQPRASCLYGHGGRPGTGSHGSARSPGLGPVSPGIGPSLAIRPSLSMA
ncbi:MAG: hypothetical protein LBL95_09755, partial [Deltaproteobacteria bacterium]|nr:hypothetical protein [Deltaproteobacteria bacterium]